jgi:SAM-dependent methyltransferase
MIKPSLDDVFMHDVIRITKTVWGNDPANFTFADSKWCWQRYITELLAVDRYIPSGAKILELGCGFGHTTAMIAHYRPDVQIIGTDITPAQTWPEFVKAGCTFRQCDATSIPDTFNELDVIISFGVIEHVNDDKKFLSDAYRCLRHGGYNIMFNVPNKWSFPEFMVSLFGFHTHDKKYFMRDMARLVNQTGFEIMITCREHCLPAQVQRVSKQLGVLFDNNYRALHETDELLCKTPACLVSQDMTIISRKK